MEPDKWKKLFVPSARQKWFLEAGNMESSGDVHVSRNVRGLETLWDVARLRGIVLSEAMMERNSFRIKQLINLGGIETSIPRREYVLRLRVQIQSLK